MKRKVYLRLSATYVIETKLVLRKEHETWFNEIRQQELLVALHPVVKARLEHGDQGRNRKVSKTAAAAAGFRSAQGPIYDVYRCESLDFAFHIKPLAMKSGLVSLGSGLRLHGSELTVIVQPHALALSDFDDEHAYAEKSAESKVPAFMGVPISSNQLTLDQLATSSKARPMAEGNRDGAVTGVGVRESVYVEDEIEDGNWSDMSA